MRRIPLPVVVRSRRPFAPSTAGPGGFLLRVFGSVVFGGAAASIIVAGLVALTLDPCAPGAALPAVLVATLYCAGPLLSAVATWVLDARVLRVWVGAVAATACAAAVWGGLSASAAERSWEDCTWLANPPIPEVR